MSRLGEMSRLVEVEVPASSGRLVMELAASQDVMKLTLGLCEILGSPSVDRLWIFRDGGYMRIGNDVTPYTIGELLEAGQLHRLVLSEDEPVISGRSA